MRDASIADVDPEVEELLVACLDRLEREGPQAIDDVCREQPERAAMLRSAVAALERLGLSQDCSPVEQGSMPERLGPFRLRSRLGGGAMGVVYLAEQEPFGRIVALKLVRPELVFFERGRERFRREAEALARLQHSGIVPVWGCGEDDGVPWIAMEPIDGASLADVLEALSGRAPASLRAEDLQPPGAARPASSTAAGAEPATGRWDEACARVVASVALALQHAHERGVLHRDIKPGNVLLARDGRVLLGDFGLALAQDASRLTASGSEVGSLPYLAPELLSGATATPASDIYALGVTLHELLTLRLPYSGATPQAVRRAILLGTAEPVRRWNPRVSWELQTICAKAMDVDPGRRYADAADLARDLGHVLARRPIEARPAGPWIRLLRTAQRHPAASVAAAVAALALVAASLLFGLQQKRHGDALRHERDVAQARFDEIRSLATGFLFEFHDAILPLDESEAARALVAARARDVLQRLSATAGTDAALHKELGVAFFKLGDVQAESAGGEPAPPEVLDSYERALDHFEAHLAAAETTGVPVPDMADDALANALEWRGKTLLRLGLARQGAGELELAEALLQRAAADFERMAAFPGARSSDFFIKRTRNARATLEALRESHER